MSTILDDFAAWRFATFHTAACQRYLEDPGHRCVCRPPAAEEPKKPTQHEVTRSRREDES